MFGIIKIIKPNGDAASPVSLRVFSPPGREDPVLAPQGAPRRAVARGAQADGEGSKPLSFGMIKFIKPNGGAAQCR